MAHARAFSFTDDAVNVAFPNASSAGPRRPMPGHMAGPQSADPALLLFQLRRAQSFWYQELHQSNRTPLTDPSPFLWQMCVEMREWGESLPATLPAGIRRMFEQELWYSYVYCIAPSARAPQINDYSRTLIFEYSLAYLGSMHDTARGGFNAAFYTHHDALKVYFMASQLIAVLRDAEDMLISGAPVPPPPSLRPAPMVPRRPMRPGMPAEDNLGRSLWCLGRIPETLALYGTRWEDATMLKQAFERMSAETTGRLRKRQQMRSAAMAQHQHGQRNGVSPPTVMHPQSLQNQPLHQPLHQQLNQQLSQQLSQQQNQQLSQQPNQQLNLNQQLNQQLDQQLNQQLDQQQHQPPPPMVPMDMRWAPVDPLHMVQVAGRNGAVGRVQEGAFGVMRRSEAGVGELFYTMS